MKSEHVASMVLGLLAFLFIVGVASHRDHGDKGEGDVAAKTANIRTDDDVKFVGPRMSPTGYRFMPGGFGY